MIIIDRLQSDINMTVFVFFTNMLFADVGSDIYIHSEYYVATVNIHIHAY